MISDEQLARYELLDLVDELRAEIATLRRRLKEARDQRDRWRKSCADAEWGYQQLIRRRLRRNGEAQSPLSPAISTAADLAHSGRP